MAPKAQPVQDFLDEAGEQTDEPMVELVLKPMDEGLDPVLSQEQICPKCGAPMVLKKAEKGRRAGKYFLMCSTFPVCKRAIPVESNEPGANS
ncbi:MAG: topoisomerase DNA-binding C4 zinc finger domain-containing protein [Ghiorsea sp.]|nr:topoisomerase DNA-binding C4 zinc finger domain-containing protein [Ghiorsea sp.]